MFSHAVSPKKGVGAALSSTTIILHQQQLKITTEAGCRIDGFRRLATGVPVILD
jgi:hypothetical protein